MGEYRSRWLISGRFFCDCALAYNLAVVLVWIRASTAVHFALLDKFKIAFPPHERFSDNYAAGYPAFFALAALFSLFLFISIRLIRRIFGAEQILRVVGAIISIAAAPIWWVYLNEILWPVQVGAIAKLFLSTEVVVAVVATLWYLRRGRPVPSWSGVLILVVYYGFWSKIFWYFFPDVLSFAVPLIGLCSALAWYWYLQVSTSDASRLMDYDGTNLAGHHMP